MRPGTYVFGDRQQMHLSGLDVDDVALVVAARVVSVPRPGEAVLDAGYKALSSDRPAWLAGHGLILEAPEATIAVLSEEHAVVRDLLTPLKVGDLVRVIPNHVCTVVNLIGELVVVEDGAVTDRWPVSPPLTLSRNYCVQFDVENRDEVHTIIWERPGEPARRCRIAWSLGARSSGRRRAHRPPAGAGRPGHNEDVPGAQHHRVAPLELHPEGAVPA